MVLLRTKQTKIDLHQECIWNKKGLRCMRFGAYTAFLLHVTVNALVCMRSVIVCFFCVSKLTYWPPEPFCQKCLFWTFWRFSVWVRAKLAPIYSKRHLQHDSVPFFPLASGFMTFLLGHVQKSKCWDKKMTYVFTRLFGFFNFCLLFLFSGECTVGMVLVLWC